MDTDKTTSVFVRVELTAGNSRPPSSAALYMYTPERGPN